MTIFRSLAIVAVSLAACTQGVAQAKSSKKTNNPHANIEFRTSDRCVACHNGLKTSSGEDISIGFDWRASMMANSARDPYWQASVRRESLDHPESGAAIEDECATCHMPAAHFADRGAGRKTKVFEHLPLSLSTQANRAASDGVTCSVCHQIAKESLGTSATFNGNLPIATTQKGDPRTEYGPFVIDGGHYQVMKSSTEGYLPQKGDQIRDSALCGTCHTLYTKALGAGGKEIGVLPEQMPYKEWLHSDYQSKSSCQSCHMPEVNEAVAITALYGEPRTGMHRHTFVGANFAVEGMLKEHRDELSVQALPQELDAALARTTEFLRTKAARVGIRSVTSTAQGLAVEVMVENLSGHKLPTAYPSRRAWLRFVVHDRDGRTVFESGALNPDGSIVGNDNDEDPLRFEPHYKEITSSQQVQIFEPILKDAKGNVTTGLLSAVGYLKDNRLLPSGFDKASADKDVEVIGEAADDPGFDDKGNLVRYLVSTGDARGPFRVEVELWYQPIGFRWAHNLEGYKAAEPRRLVDYYKSASQTSAMVLAKAEAVH